MTVLTSGVLFSVTVNGWTSVDGRCISMNAEGKLNYSGKKFHTGSIISNLDPCIEKPVTFFAMEWLIHFFIIWKMVTSTYKPKCPLLYFARIERVCFTCRTFVLKIGVFMFRTQCKWCYLKFQGI